MIKKLVEKNCLSLSIGVAVFLLAENYIYSLSQVGFTNMISDKIRQWTSCLLAVATLFPTTPYLCTLLQHLKRFFDDLVLVSTNHFKTARTKTQFTHTHNFQTQRLTDAHMLVSIYKISSRRLRQPAPYKLKEQSELMITKTVSRLGRINYIHYLLPPSHV